MGWNWEAFTTEFLSLIQNRVALAVWIPLLAVWIGLLYADDSNEPTPDILDWDAN